MKQKNIRRPLRVDWGVIDLIEKELRKTFRKFLYDPIKAILEDTGAIENAFSKPLENALRKGRIKFWDGKFTGQFSAQITKELKALGAKWHPKTASFRIPLQQLPSDLQDLLFKINTANVAKLVAADKALAKITGSMIAEHFKAKNLFKYAVKSSDDDLKSLSEKVRIEPNKEIQAAVARDWDFNIGARIGDWGDEEIKDFRQKIGALIYQGKRFGKVGKAGELEKFIMAEYGERIRATIAPGVQLEQLTEKQKESIAKKANFIARNETRLLMTQYKYTQAQNDGSTYFQWCCVIGTPKHPVRPSHKILDRKVFRWDNPPIDIQTNKKVLPGQAYNCRCTAIVLFDDDIAKDRKGNPKQLADGSYVLK